MDPETGMPRPVDVVRLIADHGPTLARAHDALNRLAGGEVVYLELQIVPDDEGTLLQQLRGLGIVAAVRPVTRSVDVVSIRRKTSLTQKQFATLFGFELATLRNWEQRRYEPTGSARTLLLVIDRQPALVQAILDDVVPEER